MRCQLSGIFRVQHRPSANFKGTLVAIYRGPVQLNRLHDGAVAQRHEALLPGRPENHHVREDGIAQGRLGQLGGIKQMNGVLQPRLQRQFQPVKRQFEIRISRKITGDHLV